MARAAAKKKEAPPPVETLARSTVVSGGTSIIKWVSEARPDKDIGPAMTFYLVGGGEIRATNGKITAAHPWPDDQSFLVSGIEFEKVIARMGDADATVTASLDGTSLTVASESFSATIETMPPDTWAYPDVQDATWLPVPENFVDVLRSLRAFISDNPAQAWAGCVALEDGNCYATNNIAVAGCACDVGSVRALLPSYAVDFLLRRVEGLESWAWVSESYVAFRWSSGAWVRSQLVIGRFPERAATLVREAYDCQPTQEITKEFRDAFGHVAGLAEDTIRIFGDHMESKFKRSIVVATCECEVPPDSEQFDQTTQKNKKVGGGMSIWGASFLAPVISQATHWSPSLWPKPAPFKGDNVAGFVVGRKE